MGITLNDYVRVRLNEHGRSILRRQRAELVATLRDPSSLPGDGVPDEDANGWSKWQLWWLISKFSDHVNAGAHAVFDEFEIEPKQS